MAMLGRLAAARWVGATARNAPRVGTARMFSSLMNTATPMPTAAAMQQSKKGKASGIVVSEGPRSIWDKTATRLTSTHSQAEVFAIKFAMGPEHHGRAAADQETPVLLLGGTAQPLVAFASHARALAATGRDIYTYEMRGQGKRTRLTLAREGPSDMLSISTHVDDFKEMFHSLELDGPVDVCGFSFGAGIALGVAAKYPDLIRRVVLTGMPVCVDAPERRGLLLHWLELLNAGDLHGMISSCIRETYSERFLSDNRAQVAKWIRDGVKANDEAGLRTLVETLLRPRQAGWSLEDLTSSVVGNKNVLMLTGELDPLAPPSETQAFARDCYWSSAVLEGAGHAVMTEAREAWLQHVTKFLGADMNSQDPILPVVPTTSRPVV